MAEVNRLRFLFQWRSYLRTECGRSETFSSDGHQRCGIALEQISYINAHATSTPVGDLNEAKAIAEVFEGHHPYVTSTKSMTGHEMWMAGASEVIYSTLMMNNGFIAPNLNFEEPDEASAQLNIPTQRVNLEFDTFLSNSFGFGGTNSTPDYTPNQRINY